jgi:putative (di)nucleoside polyphosphate hydrolase
VSGDTVSDLPYRPCVGVMLINPAGLVFVGQRLDGGKAKGGAAAWQMPQGGIDAGEKPREAALRELTEETGVSADLVEVLGKTEDWLTYDLPPELLGKVWGGKYRGQKQKWFLMRFLGTDDQVQIVQPHQEFAQWQWMHADAMLAEIVPFKRAVYETVVAAFRPHLT